MPRGGKPPCPPPARDTCPCSGAARVQPRGCKGRSPLHKITYSLPLPAGKGVGGMGAGKQTTVRVGRRQTRHAPRWGQRRQGQPATSRASPPPARDTCPCSVAARVQPRGCKGRSPLHKITYSLPLPAGKGGGGWGQQSKLKAGLAGDKEGTPPAGDSGGKVSRQPAGQAPLPPAGRVIRAPAPVPPGAPLQPNHAGITCCFGDNITKIP